MAHTIKLVDYAGWKNCILMTNGIFEAVITTEIGPRILRYGEVGGANVLYIDEFTAGQTEAPVWRAYGGRRFDYNLNEELILTAENSTTDYEIGDDRVTFRLPIDEQTSISKEIIIRMCRRGGLEIKQTLINNGTEIVNISAVAATRLQPGGLCVTSWTKGNKVKSLFKGEEVDTRRIKEGKELLFVQQDEVSRENFEFGLLPQEQWCAYFNHGNMFIITCPAIEGELEYVDNVNVAVRGLGDKFEIETRSPIYTLGSGEKMTHTEVFNIFTKNYTPKSEEEAKSALKNNKYYFEFKRKPVCGLDY